MPRVKKTAVFIKYHPCEDMWGVPLYVIPKAKKTREFNATHYDANELVVMGIDIPPTPSYRKWIQWVKKPIRKKKKRRCVR